MVTEKVFVLVLNAISAIQVFDNVKKTKVIAIKIRTLLLVLLLVQMLASIRWRCIPTMSHDNDNARNDDDALQPLRRRRWDNGSVHCFAPGAVPSAASASSCSLISAYRTCLSYLVRLVMGLCTQSKENLKK